MLCDVKRRGLGVQGSGFSLEKAAMTITNGDNEGGQAPYDDPVELALVHIQEAEHDLAKAHELEHDAEEELHEAVEELHEARDKTTTITVNSRKRKVQGHVVSYDEIVEFAFPSPRNDQPNTYYSVTYTGAAQQPSSGEMGPSGTLKVKEGSAFRVSKTIKS